MLNETMQWIALIALTGVGVILWVILKDYLLLLRTMLEWMKVQEDISQAAEEVFGKTADIFEKIDK